MKKQFKIFLRVKGSGVYGQMWVIIQVVLPLDQRYLRIFYKQEHGEAIINMVCKEGIPGLKMCTEKDPCSGAMLSIGAKVDQQLKLNHQLHKFLSFFSTPAHPLHLCNCHKHKQDDLKLNVKSLIVILSHQTIQCSLTANLLISLIWENVPPHLFLGLKHNICNTEIP